MWCNVKHTIDSKDFVWKFLNILILCCLHIGKLIFYICWLNPILVINFTFLFQCKFLNNLKYLCELHCISLNFFIYMKGTNFLYFIYTVGRKQGHSQPILPTSLCSHPLLLCLLLIFAMTYFQVPFFLSFVFRRHISWFESQSCTRSLSRWLKQPLLSHAEARRLI